jgi:hypothetical protein
MSGKTPKKEDPPEVDDRLQDPTPSSAARDAQGDDYSPENESHQEGSEDSPENPEDQNEDQNAGGEDDTVSLDDLAEMLEVNTKEIYGVQIPIGGGNFATLGQMKDSFKRIQKFDDERTEFEDYKRDQENQILTGRRQTETMVDMLVRSGQITPETLQQCERMHSARVTKENARVLQVIPSWKDPQQRQRDFEAMVEVGAEYGYSEQEIRNIPDHRDLKVLYDVATARRLKADLKNGKKPPSTIGGRGRTPPKSASRTLAERKREAKRLVGSAKRGLIVDMIAGRVPAE